MRFQGRQRTFASCAANLTPSHVDLAKGQVRKKDGGVWQNVWRCLCMAWSVTWRFS
jgi:hypothetical protein